MYAYEGSAESKMTKTAADRHKFVMHAIFDHNVTPSLVLDVVYALQETRYSICSL